MVTSRSLALFGACYFPHYISGLIPDFHLEIIEKLEQGDGHLIVWAARPRKHHVVFAHLPDLEPRHAEECYQLLFSETDTQSTKIFRNIRRAVTNANARYNRLLRDLGAELELESENATNSSSGSAARSRAPPTARPTAPRVTRSSAPDLILATTSRT